MYSPLIRVLHYDIIKVVKASKIKGLEEIKMAISEKKERIYISLEKDLMKVLREEAEKNRRFPSDEVAILIEKYLKPKYEKEEQ